MPCWRHAVAALQHPQGANWEKLGTSPVGTESESNGSMDGCPQSIAVKTQES